MMLEGKERTADLLALLSTRAALYQCQALLVDCSLSCAGKRSAGGSYSLCSLGAGPQVGNPGPVCKVREKRGSRQLGSSLWFLDHWFPSGNQVLGLAEKYKPTLPPQLAGLQVSDPANMLDIPFHIFYLSQGFAAQDSLKNTALAVTVPCGFPVILLHGATELFLMKVSTVLQEGSHVLCSGDKFSLGSTQGCHWGMLHWGMLAFTWAPFCSLATGFCFFHLGETPSVINNSLAGGTWQ